MKICCSCKICKANSEFDDLICKSCMKIRKDKKYLKKKECSICYQILPIIQFNKAPSNTGGLQKWCNSCRRDYHTIYSRQRRLKQKKCPYPNTNTIRGYTIRLIEPVEEIRHPLPADWNPNLTVSFD